MLSVKQSFTTKISEEILPLFILQLKRSLKFPLKKQPLSPKNTLTSEQ